jgi:solute carrier family 25 (peroxisomal adenine nucleotide transporter), member 17
LLGALAGALAQVFTIPVSVIATRQQIGRSSGRSRTPSVAAADRKPEVSYAQVASVPPTPSSAVINPEKGTSPTPSAKDAEVDESFLGVAREIIAEEGVGGLWLGIKPGLVLTVNPAITYGVFERVKGTLLAASAASKLTPGMSFVVGALSKTLATIASILVLDISTEIDSRNNRLPILTSWQRFVFKPGPRMRTRQLRHILSLHLLVLRITKDLRHTTVLSISSLAFGRRKVPSAGTRSVLSFQSTRDTCSPHMEQGMGAQITKAVLSQGVLFMSKDQFERWTLVIMATLYRLRRS